jgi:hypothetical protein
MTRLRSPWASVTVGLFMAVINLVIAGWQYQRGAHWMYPLVGVISAAVVTYTTIGLLLAWRDFQRAHRQYLDAVLREAERHRN